MVEALSAISLMNWCCASSDSTNAVARQMSWSSAVVLVVVEVRRRMLASLAKRRASELSSQFFLMSQARASLGLLTGLFKFASMSAEQVDVLRVVGPGG